MKYNSIICSSRDSKRNGPPQRLKKKTSNVSKKPALKRPKPLPRRIIEEVEVDPLPVADEVGTPSWAELVAIEVAYYKSEGMTFT